METQGLFFFKKGGLNLMTYEEKMDIIKYIRSNIPQEALFEMLAEKATELAKTSLELARIARCENPTPNNAPQATYDLLEEWADTLLCGEILQLVNQPSMNEMKLKRWKRWIEVYKFIFETSIDPE